jgi:hypothetical protein
MPQAGGNLRTITLLTLRAKKESFLEFQCTLDIFVMPWMRAFKRATLELLDFFLLGNGVFSFTVHLH